MRRAAILLLAVLAVGCGASAREKALSTTLASLDGARAAFLSADESYQNHVADAATTPEKADAAAAKLASYRAHRVIVVESFAVAYSALAAATLDKSSGLAEVLSAATDLYACIKALQEAFHGEE